MAQQQASDKILHQAAVEEVVVDHLTSVSSQVALDPIDTAAGAAPTDAEYDTLVASHNAVLVVLEEAGLLPAP